MSLMDVTALILGDPAARWTRQATAEERAHTQREERNPQGNYKSGTGRVSSLGLQVRAMKPGDVLVMPTYSIASGHQSYMVREWGWTMSVRRVTISEGVFCIELRRIT